MAAPLIAPVKKKAPARSRTRSRVSNGTSLFFEDVDGHTAAARRFRDLLTDVIADLGGPEGLSETHKQLARRFTALSVQSELMEARLVAGDSIDVDQLTRVIGMMSRLSSAIGLRRRTTDTGPDLAAYAASHAGGHE